MTIAETWNLEPIFAGGSRSPELVDFLAQLTIDFDAAEDTAPLPPLTAKSEPLWVDTIQTVYDLGQRLKQAAAFVGCLVSQDTSDETAQQLDADIDQYSARLGKLWAQLQAAFAEQDDAAWQHLLQHHPLDAVAFHLNEARQEARKKLPPEQETLVTALAADGYHAWNRLYGILSGDQQVEFQGKPLSLGQLQYKMYDDPDRAVRQAAFELFERTWAGIARPCAAALNSQAGFRLTLYKQRGWNNVLQEPLHNNRLSQATLNTMWQMVDAKSSKLLAYFQAKANLLGLERLGWCDVHAPIGQAERTFTYAEAAEFVVDNLAHFDPALADFARMAVQQRWIEAEDRPGKRSGGFCTGFPLVKESRIFMTFTGSVNGLLTLAHELGHAYHGWVMRDLPYGARRYAMSVAETASTFTEEIVRDAVYQAATDDTERLAILGTKLNDAAAMLMDIRSRYDFERAFFAARAKKSLTPDALSTLMVEAQQTAFKNGLTQYHPLFWASKLHFYLTGAPFYNFPYTFGYLFSSGVYAQAQTEGPAFRERYVALLRDTGRMTTEDLARKHLDVDLTRPDFWEAAIDRVLADVDEFVALAEAE